MYSIIILFYYYGQYINPIAISYQKEKREKKEIFVYGFKHIKTDKNDNCIQFGFESDEMYGNDKLFSFLSNKVINQELENRDNVLVF